MSAAPLRVMLMLRRAAAVATARAVLALAAAAVLPALARADPTAAAPGAPASEPAAHVHGAAAALAPGAAVGFEPPLGARLATDAGVTTERGEAVTLGALLGGTSLVVPVYYRCPNLCDLTLDGVAELVAAAPVDARPADVVILSFAADETPADARALRAMLVQRHPEIAHDAHWHFLTAAPQAIARTMQSIGFRFVHDPESGQYSHVAGLVVAAADGKLLGFLPGVRFDAAALAAIVAGKPAPPGGATGARGALAQALLWCFHYDPQTGRYTVAILRVLKVLGLASVLAIVAGMLLLGRNRARRHGR